MLETTDQQLAELGVVPDDLQAIITRTLGDRPITLALADELLEALSAGREFAPPAATPALPPPAIADAAAVLTSISAPPPALDSVVPPPPAAFDSIVPPPAAAAALDSVAPALATAAALESVALAADAPDSIAPPAERSRPAPMPWDSLPAPPPPAAAKAPMPWDSEPAPQQPPMATEVHAQAIVAAFDDSEPESAEPDTLESSPAPGLHMEPAPNLELNPRPARRGDWAGSRRPDLDKLLDQPLDALDFERSEQTEVDGKLPDVDDAAAADAAAPTTPPSAGDDFEILVDDEILEIAEDDVELVDDENS